MPSLNGAYARVKRASQHIANLKRRERAFVRQHQDNLVLVADPSTSKLIVRWLGSNAIIEPLLSILAGEAIYNLRSAMDYLVYELAILDTGTVQDGTQFPVCNTKSEFDRRKTKWLVGISRRHTMAIEGLQPYSGCAWAATLRDVSNPDKHRELAIIQGLMRGNFEIFVGTEDEVRKFDWAHHSIPTTKLPLGGSIPLQPGEQARVRGDIDLYLAFADGLPVFETLRRLKSEVTSMLKTFDPEFL